MKKTSLFKSVIIGLTLSYLPIAAAAWGVTGHRVVGEVADYYISAKTRKAIQQILGTESMAMAANWADFIKSDTTYNYLSSWHYVNLPADISKTDLFNFLDKDPNANIYNKTNEMIAVLKNAKSTVEQKKLALRLIIHFIGDLHQPMHTARKEDQGGNRIQLTWFGEKSNLHRVWDESLIGFQQMSYTEYTKAINHATGIKNDDKLSYKYNFDWIATVNSQLLKGGIRLAKVLNDIYK